MNELADLLTETQNEPPCGPDLSYDADFLALENAAQGKAEQQFGDTVIASEPPDWRDVENKAHSLLSRTKDLRIAGLLCRAITSLRGMEGAADAIELIAGMIEGYWPTLHPLPEDGDHFMRLNALAFLDDSGGFLLQMRQTPLVRTPLGAVLVRDAEALIKGMPLAPNCTLSGEQIRIGVAKAWAQGDESLKCVSRIQSALQRIASGCAQHLPETQRPALDTFRALMKVVAEVLPASANASHAQAAAVQDERAGSSGQDPQGSAPAAGPGPLRTREDAIAQLMRAAEFLESTEPTNPAPLLIRRAVRLMQMGFIDIVRELSPDSIAQIENITGTRSDS